MDNMSRELARLERMTIPELRRRYLEVFGEEASSHNKVSLVRRLAWRLQSLAEGGLSERAQRRAAELANDADIRMKAPTTLALPEPAPERTTTQAVRFQSDERLPPPGTTITRKYKGQTLQVKVLPQGFEYDGEVYASLSAVAKAITGSHCNGFLFFRLARNGDQQ
jgi:hypothetical protein